MGQEVESSATVATDRGASAPQDPALAARIKGYAEYFAGWADRSYDASLPGKYRSAPGADDWKPPLEAIGKELDNPWSKSPGWAGLDRDTFLPAVERWLADNHITALAFKAHGYNGWTAGNFTAKTAGSPIVQNFRIGNETGRMHHFIAPWNPLLLRTNAQNIFVARDDAGEPYKLSLSRGPIATMVPPRQPPGFDAFLNDYVLKGTPFRVKDHKDLSVLFDGTPLYGDPDSVGFATPELARAHAKDVRDPAWQQKILGIIHENCEKLGLPPQLRWTVETSPGVFSAKQPLVNPDPAPHAPPGKTVVRLRQAAKPRNPQPAPNNAPKTYDLRAARPDDRDSVASLLLQNYFESGPVTAEQDAMTHAHAEGYLGDPAKKMFLAFDGNKPVGFAVVVPDSKRGGLLVDGLFTVKEYEHQGIASKLMGQCEDYARSKGQSELHLSVEVSKADVKAFYEKRGWKADTFDVTDAAGTHRTDIDPRNSRVATHLMRKPLTENAGLAGKFTRASSPRAQAETAAVFAAAGPDGTARFNPKPIT